MERRRLIGEILVEHGWVTPQDVNEALRKQAELAEQGAAGTKTLGAILVEMGKVTNDQVRQALEEQGMAIYSDQGPTMAGSGVWGAEEHISAPVPPPPPPAAAGPPPRPRPEPERAPAGIGVGRGTAGSETDGRTAGSQGQAAGSQASHLSEPELMAGQGGAAVRRLVAPAVIALVTVLAITWYLQRRWRQNRLTAAKRRLERVLERVAALRPG